MKKVIIDMTGRAHCQRQVALFRFGIEYYLRTLDSLICTETRV